MAGSCQQCTDGWLSCRRTRICGSKTEEFNFLRACKKEFNFFVSGAVQGRVTFRTFSALHVINTVLS